MMSDFSLWTRVEVPKPIISSNETLGQLPEATSTGRAFTVKVNAHCQFPDRAFERVRSSA
jgi:hypothetical protein